MKPVRDTSAIGETRRDAAQFARDNGFGEAIAGRVALVGSEMATNMLRHGGGGSMVIDRFADRDGTGMELLALDQGPGMADVAKCLEDGYSSAGSSGNGLGIIAGQSDRFGIYSRPGKGTAVMARFRAADAGGNPVAEIGAVRDPYPGETVCGDRWIAATGRGSITLLLVDGSGHGAQAAHAAEFAAQAFTDNLERECVPLAEAIHRALAPTRGAALAVARIDKGARVVRYVGIGNIAGLLVSGDTVRRLTSNNGTAGHIAPRIREFTYPFVERPLVILNSDGLTTRWEIGDYGGLGTAHPSLIAGVLMRDQRRGRDDATVVAVRDSA